jgi:hypothetical protein
MVFGRSSRSNATPGVATRARAGELDQVQPLCGVILQEGRELLRRARFDLVAQRDRCIVLPIPKEP